MNERIQFLLVTANQNETEALLNDKMFKYVVKRSEDANDTAYYNVGEYGSYKVVHFQLNQQGSVGSDSSQLAIASAINSYHPDAVILLGIAFGKGFYDDPNRSQNIGDVLISSSVIDYESGKVKKGKIQPDGLNVESGRQLLSAFRHYSRTWNHKINGKKAKCEIGSILSGDKVVDDLNFKKKLINMYPRAIGGEMEGRGAYSACKNRGVEEWIVIKSICDWADGTKSTQKQKNQEVAAKSTVSLLHYVFSDPKAFNKIPKLTNGCQNKDSATEVNTDTNEVIGYFINFGVTTCRLFEILKDGKILKEVKTICYEISDSKDTRYLKGIIEHVKNEIFPIIKEKNNQMFLKAFADASFSDVFPNEIKRNDFIMDFYTETNLYFNILSQRQTEENLKRLFKKFENETAIVNIGSEYIDIMVRKGSRFNMYNLNLTLKDVMSYISKHRIPEEWDEDTIEQIKTFINDKIKDVIKKVKAKNVVIIKDELKFMTELGYPLRYENGSNCITFEDYKKSNRDFLFNGNYRDYVDENYPDKAIANRMYGFKVGHIVLEKIFECIGTKEIIPSDELSIHGSLNAYIFNVVISGSTKNERDKYMIEAHKIMTDMGATVLSPRIVKGKLSKQNRTTDIKHANAIRECDLLFVCNKDEYIGEQTAREIYGAFILNKPIAFWREPKNVERLEYIPHEQWANLMPFLLPSEE